MNPTDARLFADFAAVPTKRERRASRTFWRTAQRDLFAPIERDHLDDAPALCAVCAGDHAAPCPLGTAAELFG